MWSRRRRNKNTAYLHLTWRMLGVLLVPVILSLLLSGIFLNVFTPTPILASDKYEYNESTSDNYLPCYGGYMGAQSFQATDTYYLDEVRLKLSVTGSPGTVYIQLYTLGVDPLTLLWRPLDLLDTATLSGSAITTDNAGAWYSANLEYSLVNGYNYAVVTSVPSGNAAACVNWHYDSTGGYTDGQYYDTDDGGITWSGEAGYDFMFSNWGDTLAPTGYEEYATGGNATDNIYGSNWRAQTFTTDNVPHTAAYISLKLYRVNNPGTVTVGIQEVASGLPDGVDLASGTIDGNILTTDNSGDWYQVAMTSSLHMEVEHQYGIVVRAASGNATDYACWLYNPAGAYADGQYATSNNSGNTWSAEAASDAMFSIDGDPTARIIDVAVYTGFAQEGDMIFLIHYNCEVPPAYPQDSRSYLYYYLSVENATDNVVAKVGVPSWGYKPASIYLSPEARQYITWGKDTTITLTPYPGSWDPLPETTTLELTLDNFVGSDMFSLDSWVLDTASLMEIYYGVDMVTTYTDDEGTIWTVLTMAAGEIFTTGIPGLDDVRPYLFSYIEWTTPDETPSGTNAGQKDLEDTMGPQFVAMFQGWADALNVDSYQAIAGLFMLAMTIGAAGLGMFLAQDVRGGILGAAPIVIIGFGLGFWSLVWLAMGCITVTIVFVWVMWLRGT